MVVIYCLESRLIPTDSHLHPIHLKGNINHICFILKAFPYFFWSLSFQFKFHIHIFFYNFLWLVLHPLGPFLLILIPKLYYYFLLFFESHRITIYFKNRLILTLVDFFLEKFGQLSA